MKKFVAGMVGLVALATTPLVATAQQPADTAQASDANTDGEAPPAKDAKKSDDKKKADDKKKSEKDKKADGEATQGGEAAPATTPPPVDAAKDSVEAAEQSAAEEATPKPEPEPAPKPEPAVPDVDASNPFGDSPIADLADKEFVPLEDIEEGGLEQIIPARVYPSIDLDGTFRTRVRGMVNWDLDTEGTSAVLPPAESFAPIGSPANEDKDTHWDANLSLRLQPTLNITEELRVVMELDLLDNMNFGSLPAGRLGADPLTPQLGATGSGAQLSPREREFFADALKVNELYGEVDTLLGKLSMGRMDSHWGLGIRANDGDCPDCDTAGSFDRLKFQTKFWRLYGAVSMDFVDEGLFSRVVERDGGQPYDIAQIDDVDQYTVSVFHKALTREEKELQGKRLLDDQLPVFNGGLLYRYRKQDGRFVPLYNGESFDPVEPRDLIYRGEKMHLLDLWAEFLYEPDFETRVRVGIEGLAWLGNVDNVSDSAVGLPEEAGEKPINCFDGDTFSANEAACTTDADGGSTDQNVQQFALALESEFRFGGPVSFGLNGGLASGGSTANWGTTSPDLSFYRFNPDYHVDLILFRNVIGTVTNAYYANPWAMLKFLESNSRHIELQVDGIASAAYDKAGTPSGTSQWLGLEFDGALRYVNLELFTAALEAGILFPFEGLNAAEGRTRFRSFGSNTADFQSDISARIAWTLQAKLFWNF